MEGQSAYMPSEHPVNKSKKGKVILIISLCVAVIAAAAVFGYFYYPSRSSSYSAYIQSRNTFLPNVSVEGINLGGMTQEEAWNAVYQRVSEWQNSWSLEVACDGFTYSRLNYAALGIQTDYEALDTMLSKAWSLGHRGGYNEYRQDLESLEKEPYQAYPEQKQGSNDQLDLLLSIIQSNVYRAPVDAVMTGFDPSNTKSPFSYRASAYGQTIDIEQAKSDILQLAASGESGKYEIPIKTVAPKTSLEDVKADYTLLSEYYTAIDKHSTDERNANIALVLSKINGKRINSGERFSFNSVVGKRNEQNGFKTAMGYISGELAEVVGGGVCQASTTVYAAALCAGMTIQNRTPHSIPVSYISLGQDATVNDMRGHEIDLVFRNKTSSPVYITCAIETNATGRMECVVRFWGRAQEDGSYFRLDSVIVETLEIPEEVIRQDKEGKYVKYTNQRYKYSAGAEGYVVKTYLQQYKNGEVVKSTLISTDTYKARPDIYYVGVTERQ